MAYSPAQKRAYWAQKNKQDAERLKNKKPFVPLATPSCFQQAIFDEIRNGSECLIIDAVAGSGKSTTLLNGLLHIPEGKTACFCAFGHDTSEELKLKCPIKVKEYAKGKFTNGIDINTTHSFGGRAVKKRFPNAQLDKFKLREHVIARVGDPYKDQFGTPYEKVDEDLLEKVDQVQKAVSLSKQCLAHDEDSMIALIDQYSLEFISESERKKCNDEEYEIRLQAFIRECLFVQNQTKLDTSRYDFDDMLWMPVVFDLAMEQFDIVFVDETQDLNKCQMHLVMKMMRRGGRIIACGDERQAIYLFRGADQHSMQMLVDGFKAKRLPLSFTYRCCKAVVRYVKDNVPGMDHLQTPDTAIEGEVAEATFETMLKEIQPGDFVVSRLNAPNVSLALHLICNNRRANIRGKDLGGYFKFFIKKSQCKDIAEFMDYVLDWKEKQLETLHKRKKKPANMDAMVENIHDRSACMMMLAEGCNDLQSMQQKITDLFTDQAEENIIILGTTHKLKGLERKQVWLLNNTFKPGKNIEEDNLLYVAATRAKEKLNIVQGQLREQD